MKVLVDSSVWSLAMRRKKHQPDKHVKLFHELVKEGRVVLIGPVRQEILSGIRERSQFHAIKEKLSAWVDLAIETADYERAAECFNACRSNGIQGTHTDFLICAVAERLQLSILTSDQDFVQYERVLPVKLLKP